MTVYRYYEGYKEAQKKVLNQSLADDLTLIDDLFGRKELEYGATPEEVKQEALRQLEIEYRKEVNEEASFWVDVYKHSEHLR